MYRNLGLGIVGIIAGVGIVVRNLGGAGLPAQSGINVTSVIGVCFGVLMIVAGLLAAWKGWSERRKSRRTAAPSRTRTGGRMPWLALVSLVSGLGIFLTAGLSGVVAVVTGHLARRRALARGRWAALAGLILGYCGLVFVAATLVCTVLPSQRDGIPGRPISLSKPFSCSLGDLVNAEFPESVVREYAGTTAIESVDGKLAGKGQWSNEDYRCSQSQRPVWLVFRVRKPGSADVHEDRFTIVADGKECTSLGSDVTEEDHAVAAYNMVLEHPGKRGYRRLLFVIPIDAKDLVLRHSSEEGKMTDIRISFAPGQLAEAGSDSPTSSGGTGADNRSSPAGQVQDPPRAKREGSTLVLRHDARVTQVALSKDGTKLASAGEDNAVRVWDVSDGTLLTTYTDHTGTLKRVYGAVFSPDSTRLASAGWDLCVWRAKDGQRMHRFEEFEFAYCTAWSPDGRKIAAGSLGMGGNGPVAIWDASTYTLLHKYEHRGRTWKVAFSPDSKLLASAGDDGVQVRDAESGRRILHYSGHGTMVHDVAFSPNGKLIASSDEDHRTHVWKPDDGKMLAEVQGYYGLAFSPDGAILVTTYDKTIFVYDARTWGLLRKHTSPHGGWVTDAAFSPDGKRFVTASADGTIRLSSLESLVH